MHRLIYKSKAPFAIDKESFRDILYTSVAINRKHKINGALIATRSHFLQFLEGEYGEVEETYARIKEDKRHTDIKLISFSEVEQSLFSEWRMRGIGLFDMNIKLEKHLKEKYGTENGVIKLPEDEEKAIEFVKDVGMTGTTSLEP